jgi:hypothetical protein
MTQVRTDKRRLFFWFFGLGLFFLCLVYFPATSMPYFWHEDGRFFEDRSGGLLINLGDFELTAGRYLLSLFHYFFSVLPINRIADLFFIRLVTIPFIAFALALFALWLYKYFKFNPRDAFFLSSAVFTLPAISAMIKQKASLGLNLKYL